MCLSRGKPAPALFIYAAGWMRAPIVDCLVIEDSVPGVTAARAAGVRDVGLSGGSHFPPGHWLERPGDAACPDVRPGGWPARLPGHRA